MSYPQQQRTQARPVPDFEMSHFFSQPSAKALTQPKSPNFATNKRARRGE